MFPKEQIMAALANNKGLSDDGTYGVCTAGRIKKNRPEIYEAAVAMLKNCVPMKEIARALGLGMHTVMAIADLDAEVIAQSKEKMAATLMTDARMAGEMFREMLGRMKITDKNATPDAIYKLMLTMGIAVDKASLLSGDPTERVVVTDERYNGSWRDYASKYCNVVDAEVVEAQSSPTESTKSET